PAVLRTVGQWMGKIRRMAAEFQGQFQEAMREAEMADLKKSIDAITDATRGIGSGFDPIASGSKDIVKTFSEKPASFPRPPAPPRGGGRRPARNLRATGYGSTARTRAAGRGRTARRHRAAARIRARRRRA